MKRAAADSPVAVKDADPPCEACGRRGVGRPGNRVLLCDGCDAALHQRCVGVLDIPAGDWFCAACKRRRKHLVARAPIHLVLAMGYSGSDVVRMNHHTKAAGHSLRLVAVNENTSRPVDESNRYLHVRGNFKTSGGFQQILDRVAELPGGGCEAVHDITIDYFWLQDPDYM